MGRRGWWIGLAGLVLLAAGCREAAGPASGGERDAGIDSRPASLAPADHLGAGDWELTITSSTPAAVLPGGQADAHGVRGPHDYGHRVRLAGGRIEVTLLESRRDSFASDEQSRNIARLVAGMDWKKLARTQGAGPAGSRTYVLKLVRQGETFEVTTCGVDCCADCARLLEFVREVSGYPRL